MNKITISLLLLAVFALTAHAQRGNDNKSAPPVYQDDQSQVSSLVAQEDDENWYCEIEFYYNGKSYYYENLSYDDSEAYRGKLSKKLDNKIDSIYWSGSRCNCWVVVYQSKYFNGLNLGLWTDSNDGSYDLSKYTTYDWNDGSWESWGNTVSSYSVYCY